MLLENGSFIDGLIQTSDSTVTSLALGNCDPLTITLVGHGGHGGSAGSGYVTQYNLNLYESLTELRVEVSSSTSTRSTRVSLAEANILLALAEAGAGGGDNGGNGYSGG